MKIIAGWVVALAMFAGTGTAIALNAKLQWTLADERCAVVSCRPESPARHRPAQRTTLAAPSQSQPIQQTEPPSQASRVDRSRKADRIAVVGPATHAALPAACEPPFSPLAKLAPRNFTARCLS